MAEATKEFVVGEARRLFYQFGFRRITMDEIARNLRMNKKTLYALFPAKNDLVRAVVDSIMEPNLGKISSLMREEKSVAGLLSGSIAVFHGLSQAISEPMISDMRTMPEIWSYVEKRRLKVLMGLREVLERGKRSGEVRPDLNIDLFLRIYFLIVNAVGNPTVIMELNITPSELAEQIYGILIHGIINAGRRPGGAS